MLSLQHLSQSGLVEWRFTAGELGHLAGIDVHADDLVTELGHARGVGGAEVSRTEDGAPHIAGITAGDELTAPDTGRQNNGRLRSAVRVRTARTGYCRGDPC